MIVVFILKKHQVFLFQINKYYVVVGTCRPQPTTWNAIRFFFIAGIYSHCVQCVRTHKMRTRTQGYTLLFGQESCHLKCNENSNIEINILLNQFLAKMNKFLLNTGREKRMLVINQVWY